MGNRGERWVNTTSWDILGCVQLCFGHRFTYLNWSEYADGKNEVCLRYMMPTPWRQRRKDKNKRENHEEKIRSSQRRTTGRCQKREQSQVNITHDSAGNRQNGGRSTCRLTRHAGFGRYPSPLNPPVCKPGCLAIEILVPDQEYWKNRGKQRENGKERTVFLSYK